MNKKKKIKASTIVIYVFLSLMLVPGPAGLDRADILQVETGDLQSPVRMAESVPF